jgi:hypothetical protein
LTSNPNINAWFQFDQGFDEYVDSTNVLKGMPLRAGQVVGGPPGIQSAEVMTKHALAMLDRHAQKLETQPFFMQILYIDPHRPYRKHDFSEIGVRFHGPDRLYNGEIRHVDSQIGALLEGLEHRGLLADTLVVVTSDHGEGLRSHPGVPYSIRHGYHLYRSALHVPLILSHPSLAPGVIDAHSSSVDVLPTLMELLGFVTEGGHGLSFAEAVKGTGSAPERSFIYAETDWRQANKVSILSPSHQYIRGVDSIRFQEQGVHEGRDLPDELREFLALPIHQIYEWKAPGFAHPSERNSWGTNPGRDRALADALDRWESSTPSRAPLRRVPTDVDTLKDGSVIPFVQHGSIPEMAPGIERQLQALGYLEEPELR